METGGEDRGGGEATSEEAGHDRSQAQPPSAPLSFLQQPFLQQYFAGHPQPSQPSSLPSPPSIPAAGPLSASQSTLARSSSEHDHHDDAQDDPQLQTMAKPKRNPRQQEQNKQAQQRYRAKRKAQFEEMQSTVQVLSRQVQDLQREKQSSTQLQVELLRLQALLSKKDSALQVAAAELQCLRTSGTSSGGSKAAEDEAAAAAAGGGVMSPRTAAAAAANASSMLISPEAAAGPSAPAAAAAVAAAAAEAAAGELPRPQLPQLAPLAAGLSSAAAVVSAAGGGSLSPPGNVLQAAAAGAAAAVTPSPSLIQHALQMYYQDLQRQATVAGLDHLPPSGRGVSAEVLLELQRLLRAGTELIRMVLQASGPGAQGLLLGSAAGTANEPALHSPADNHQLWQQVALRLQLSPEQRQDIGRWRDQYVQRLDEVYGRRLLLKAQVVQISGAAAGGPGAAAAAAAGSSDGAQPQWAESVLLSAVSSSGYSSSAHAAVELDILLESLRENVRQERDMAADMMQVLLTQVLTPIQAARYLLAGHPFTWNGLAFAHSLASLPP